MPAESPTALGARAATHAADKPAPAALPPALRADLWHQRIAFSDGSVAVRLTEGSAWKALRLGRHAPAGALAVPCGPKIKDSRTQAETFAAQQNRLAKWPQPPCPFATGKEVPPCCP